MYPADRPEIGERSNRARAPLDGDDYDLLVSVVDSAIALHKTPKFPEQVVAALRGLREILVEFAKLIAALTVAAMAIPGLLASLNTAIEALDIFLAGLL